MANIKKFDFNNFQVRTFYKNNEIWFVAKDVCDILEINNSRQAISHLDSDEKDDVITNDVTGRCQEFTIINESGLYSLILKSRKPQSKEFKKWITSEVLPSIRKTGKYELGLKSDKELLFEALLQAKDLETQLVKSQLAIMEAKSEVLEAQKLVVEKENYILKATSSRPGLEKMLEDFQTLNPIGNFLPSNSPRVSLYEWMVNNKQIVLEGHLFKKFISKVHGAFKAINNTTPNTELRQLAKNKFKTKVQVYELKDYPILDQCYKQTILEN